MTATIHNNVFDAALDHIINNAVEAEVQNSAGSPLVDGVSLDTGNFGTISDNPASSGGGRTVSCLVSSASDMKNVSVSTAGSAYQVALKNASSAELVKANISSAPITLGSSDQVNMGQFSTTLKDPA